MGEILKPCPFCGGEAAWFSYGGGGYYAACRNPECIAEINGFDTAEQAVNAWNRRVDPYDVYEGMKPMTDENMAALGWVRERTCTMPRLSDCTCQYMHRYMCSECGEYNEQPTAMGESEPPNYCPGCGAKVVGE